MGSPVIRIRQAEETDAAAIAAVQVRSWQWAYRGQLPDAYLERLPETLPQREAGWRQAIAHSYVWVAEQDGVVVGFVSAGPSRDADAAPNIGEVYAIYLEEKVVGSGVGRALLDVAVESLRAQGFNQATLWVLATNSRARRFYEKAGWQPDGATKTDERPGCLLHEVRYRRRLADS